MHKGSPYALTNAGEEMIFNSPFVDFIIPTVMASCPSKWHSRMANKTIT